MKNLLIILGLATTLTSFGGQFVQRDFLNGNNIILTNNQTINYGGTNIVFIGTSSNQLLSYATTVLPVTWVNGTAYYTNSTFVLSNAVGAAWKDLPLWPDGLANYGKVRIVLTCALDGVAATNVYNWVFAPIYTDISSHPQDRIDVDTLNNNNTALISIRQVMNGSTNSTISTNLLQAQVEGIAGYRFVSVANANSTTNAVGYIRRVSLTGWVP